MPGHKGPNYLRKNGGPQAERKILPGHKGPDYLPHRFT